MKLRHDEIRKKYGKNNGSLFLLAGAGPAFPVTFSARQSLHVGGGSREHVVDHWSPQVFVPPSAFQAPVCP